MRHTFMLSLSAVLLACGGGAAGPKSAAPDPAVRVEAAPHAAATPLPTCSDESEDCLPPADWVQKLCGDIHPELALHMFRGGSPWKRLYSRANAPAFNGAGGPSLANEYLEVGEELIALRRHTESRGSGAGEMSVGNTASYDVLRWNGTCVTLHDGEYSHKPPRRRQHAHVEWRWLNDELWTVLRSDGSIGEAYVERRKECKGATLGRVTKKCVEREESLVAAIVNYVRAGGRLPAPTERL